MATSASNFKTIRLTGGKDGGVGVITGPGTSAKPGETVKFDKFTANMLIQAGLGEEYQPKKGEK